MPWRIKLKCSRNPCTGRCQRLDCRCRFNVMASSAWRFATARADGWTFSLINSCRVSWVWLPVDAPDVFILPRAFLPDQPDEPDFGPPELRSAHRIPQILSSCLKLTGLCLIGAAATAGAEFLDGFFDRFPGFAGAFLNPPSNSSCLPSTYCKSSSVSVAHFCFSLPLVMFQSPLISSVFILFVGFFVPVRRQRDGEKLQLSSRTRPRQRRAVRWGFNSLAVSEATKPQPQ